MSNLSIRYIVSDNDGVNIDSEDVAMQVMDDFGYALVKRYRPDAPLEKGDIYSEYPGTSTDAIVEALITKYGLPEGRIRADYNIEAGASIPEILADSITIETNQCFMSGGLKAIPGMVKSLTRLKEKYSTENMALCTTSREDRMDISLEHAADPETGANAGLADFYPKGPQRLSGYGHDNKYTLFLQQSGWDPSRIAVIEDSISGVKKAKAASDKIRVVGTAAAKFYTDKAAHAKKLVETGASIVVTNGADLHKAIEWLNTGFDPKQKPAFSSPCYPADSPSPERKNDLNNPPTLTNG